MISTNREEKSLSNMRLICDPGDMKAILAYFKDCTLEELNKLEEEALDDVATNYNYEISASFGALLLAGTLRALITLRKEGQF